MNSPTIHSGHHVFSEIRIVPRNDIQHADLIIQLEFNVKLRIDAPDALRVQDIKQDANSGCRGGIIQY